MISTALRLLWWNEWNTNDFVTENIHSFKVWFNNEFIICLLKMWPHLLDQKYTGHSKQNNQATWIKQKISKNVNVSENSLRFSSTSQTMWKHLNHDTSTSLLHGLEEVNRWGGLIHRPSTTIQGNKNPHLWGIRWKNMQKYVQVERCIVLQCIDYQINTIITMANVLWWNHMSYCKSQPRFRQLKHEGEFSTNTKTCLWT